MIWRITDEETKSDSGEDQEKPEELLFIHGGHGAPVSDISWNPYIKSMLASTDEDNILQVWKYSKATDKDMKEE